MTWFAVVYNGGQTIVNVSGRLVRGSRLCLRHMHRGTAPDNITARSLAPLAPFRREIRVDTTLSI